MLVLPLLLLITMMPLTILVFILNEDLLANDLTNMLKDNDWNEL